MPVCAEAYLQARTNALQASLSTKNVPGSLRHGLSVARSCPVRKAPLQPGHTCSSAAPPSTRPDRLSYGVTDPPTHRVESDEAPFDLSLELVNALGSDKRRYGSEILPDGVTVVEEGAGVQNQDAI